MGATGASATTVKSPKSVDHLATQCGSKINYWSGWRLHQIDPVSDPPTGDGGDRHEGQVHPAQAEEGPQLQADGRRRVKKIG